MTWKKLKISDFAEVITGGTPPTSIKEYWENGNVPWLNSGELNKRLIKDSKNFITELGLKNSSARMMPSDTVLVALTGATTGLTALLKINACANQSVTGILPSKKHHPEFLYYYFLTQRKNILSKAWGGAQPHINQKYVKDYLVPLPPVSDQRHIANILSKAEALIAQRKQSISLLDELLKSTFLEMFGDPVRNEKGWEKVLLSTLGKLDRGVSKNRPRNAPELLGGAYPLIQTGEIANSGLYIKSFSQTYSELGFKQSKMWKKGTLCITIAANIGRTSILDFDACFPDSIVGFVTNVKDSNTIYVYFLFSFLQKILEKNAPQAAQKNINLDLLRNLQVPKPPLELQKQFAQIVEKTEALKTHYQQSLQELENLYGSLSQRAFKGELFTPSATPEVSLPKLEKLEEKHFLKRKVLGTYIINQSLDDPRFGDVKFEKLLHLSDYFAIKRNLNQNYIQKAAGPYDNKFTIPFFEQITRDKWFIRTRRGSQYIFKKGAKHDSSTKTYNFFSNEELERINRLISYFKKYDYEQSEIVSTLYAVWNNRIIKDQPITDELLKEDFLNWDIKKAKYKDRLDAALKWMRKEGIVPDGWGKVIEKPKSKRHGKK